MTHEISHSMEEKNPIRPIFYELNCSDGEINFDLEVSPFFFKLDSLEKTNDYVILNSYKIVKSESSDSEILKDKKEYQLELISLQSDERLEIKLEVDEVSAKIQIISGPNSGRVLPCSNIKFIHFGSPRPATPIIK